MNATVARVTTEGVRSGFMAMFEFWQRPPLVGHRPPVLAAGWLVILRGWNDGGAAKPQIARLDSVEAVKDQGAGKVGF